MEKKDILFSEEDIQKIIGELAEKIKKHYGDKEIVVVSLLRGSFIFTADLIRKLDQRIIVDFLTSSSYHNDKISSGFVEILNDIRENIEGKDVLLVDDILDSGRTMKVVKEHLFKKNPNTLMTCVLLDKPSRRVEDIEADFVGAEIEDRFIVGYGLNYGDYYRNVPYIYTLD